LLASFGIVTGIAGCIFSPEKGGHTIIPPEVYGTPSTPEKVLTNLKVTYEGRDSVLYKAVYDSSYIGSSTANPGAPEQVSLEFTYSDEIASLAGMARSTTITRVSLDLGGNYVRQASDDLAHPEYATIQTGTYRIEVVDGVNDWRAFAGAGDFIQFTFKPTTPAPSSSTDTLWSIVRWTEIGHPQN
jgi:hypothetical protein